jgi:hypothetical protein
LIVLKKILQNQASKRNAIAFFYAKYRVAKDKERRSLMESEPKSVSIEIADLIDDAVTNAVARRQKNADVELSPSQLKLIRGGTVSDGTIGVVKFDGPTVGLIAKEPEVI